MENKRTRIAKYNFEKEKILKSVLADSKIYCNCAVKKKDDVVLARNGH